jgi:hypothetical protein
MDANTGHRAHPLSDGSDNSAYEAPELVPIGNLRDVVAGTTKQNQCDSVSHNPTGDGDVAGFSC